MQVNLGSKLRKISTGAAEFTTFDFRNNLSVGDTRYTKVLIKQKKKLKIAPENSISHDFRDHAWFQTQFFALF